MIKVNKISKSFTGRKILDQISFDINEGDTVAIIGQSGVGKSVILKHLNGLLKPDSGNIEIDNLILNHLSFNKLQKIRKRMSMVFQFGALFDSLNIYANIKLALDNLTNLNDIEKDKRIKESLKLVNLLNTKNMFPSDLSGGMKKRIGIARAISIKPKYIMYDEPTTGLDPINTDKIIRLIKNVQKKDKMTSIIVTHEMKIVNEIANKIIMLSDRKVIFDGTPNELNSSNDNYIKYFILGRKQGKK